MIVPSLFYIKKKKNISQRKDLIKFFFRRITVTTMVFWGGGRFAGGKGDWKVATVKKGTVV